MADKLFTFIRRLPKIELHAHISGCIRESTLRELFYALGPNHGAPAHAVQLLEERWRERDAAAEAEATATATDDDDNAHHLFTRRSLAECFALFDLIHACVTDRATVARVTREAIEDFAADNVAYLELRTTPRRLADGGTGADGGAGAGGDGGGGRLPLRAHIDTVLRTIRDTTRALGGGGYAAHAGCGRGGGSGGGSGDESAAAGGIDVRLLLSIDRSGTAADALAVVELAEAYRRESRSDAAALGALVVGVDLSGNPTKGDFATFAPALARARASGIRTSLHCAEVAKQSNLHQSGDGGDGGGGGSSSSSSETARMLAFRPDRLGHALWLAPGWVASLLGDPAPIEVCPTSNLATLELDDLRAHPTLGRWLREGYPVCLCTDDPGVFATSLSAEYLRVARAFGLGAAALGKLALTPVDFAFGLDGAARARLRARIGEVVATAPADDDSVAADSSRL